MSAIFKTLIDMPLLIKMLSDNGFQKREENNDYCSIELFSSSSWLILKLLPSFNRVIVAIPSLVSHRSSPFRW